MKYERSKKELIFEHQHESYCREIYFDEIKLCASGASEKKIGGAVEDIRNVLPKRPGEAKK